MTLRLRHLPRFGEFLIFLFRLKASPVPHGKIPCRLSVSVPRRMSLASQIRSFIPLAIGLAVDGLGATLFLQSMPAPEGSPETHANKLE